jgi:catechol 2,3-dioxygenase-like lactoylglutathione lyase family enzyme
MAWEHNVPSAGHAKVGQFLLSPTSPASWYTPGDDVQHIAYYGDDDHIHECFFRFRPIPGQPFKWEHNIPSAGDIGVLLGTSPSTWYTPSDDVQHIAYVGDDEQIHECFFRFKPPPGQAFKWEHNIPSAGQTKASTSPTSWYTRSDDVQHIAYVGKDGQIHECFFRFKPPPGQAFKWEHNIPSAGHTKVQTGASPTSWYTPSDDVQHIAYVGDDAEIHECFFRFKPPPGQAFKWEHNIPSAGHTKVLLRTSPTSWYTYFDNVEHIAYVGTDQQIHECFLRLPQEVAFPVRECVYNWTARYLQRGTDVTIRIQLNPDAGIPATTVATLQTTWANGIVGKWSNRFDCAGSDGDREPITCRVEWVNSNAHHVVRVRPGPARSNMTTWDTSDTGDVAAHEFGHMLGNPDEYAEDPPCSLRNPVNTGTVMDNNTGGTIARHYNEIARVHGNHTPAQRGLSPEPPDEDTAMVVNRKVIDNLRPDMRASVLQRLRGVGEQGPAPEWADQTEVSFQVSGGTPGQRYIYRITIRGNGAAERFELDEFQSQLAEQSAGIVDRELTARVFAAAAEVGLLDDSAPAVPLQPTGEIVPDSMIALITMREGDSVRQVILPAEEPGSATDLPGEPAEVPMETHVHLPRASVDALQPVLDALAVVESNL